METNRKMIHRRMGIIIHFIILICLVGFFEFVHFSVQIEPPISWLVLLLLFLILIMSFIHSYWKTGIWKLAHMGFKTLDERQIMVISNAIRISYSIFTIFTLLIIYGFILIVKLPLDAVIAFALLYMAHILPCAVIGWSEKLI